jgi:hypothetical protein
MDLHRVARHNAAMMAEISTRERKKTKLAQADRHMAAAESLVARQLILLRELERDGHATKTVRNLLETMCESVHQMSAHRRLIEAEPDAEG